MSVFNNTYTNGVSNMFPINKPAVSTSGQIYMKSDKLLYYLDTNNIEYLLSATGVPPDSVPSTVTFDFIYVTKTSSQTLTASDYITWDTVVNAQDNIYLGISDPSVINIGTSGIYNLKFNVIVNCTGGANGSDPYIEVYPIINRSDTNASIRLVGSKEQLLVNSGNYSYSQSYDGLLNLNTGDTVQIKINQISGSTTAVLAGISTNLISLSLNKVFTIPLNGDLLTAYAGVNTYDTGVLYDIKWNLTNLQSGNILIRGDTRELVKVLSSGYYFITYNIDLTGNSITGLNPTLESYITVNNNDNTTTKRFGRHHETLLISSGNLSYKSTVPSIIKLSIDDILRFKIKQTTGSNLIEYSGVNDVNTAYKVSSVNLHKVDSIDVISLDVGSVASVSGTPSKIVWDALAVDTQGSIITHGTTASQIKVVASGTYDVVYTVEVECSDNSITGFNPTIESYISINTDSIRHGLYSKSILAPNGNMTYSYTKTTRLLLTSGDYIELNVIQITGSNAVTFSSGDNNRKMNITVFKR
jgi:protein involved in polysaccharide export with SLBB domain